MAQGPGKFLGELKRRHVLRVVGVYAVGAWLAIQIADTTFPYLALPSWSVLAVIVFAIIGFPIAVAVAWSFDLTAEGIERADPLTGSDPEKAVAVRPNLSGRRLVVSLVVITVVSTAGWLWFRSVRPTAPVHLDTVLVLPFQYSGSSQLRYLEDGLVDLVARNLEGVAGLRAIDPHTSIRVAQAESQNGPIDAARGQHLAQQIGANYFVLGTATEHDGRLVLSARMFDALSTELPLETPTVEGEASTLFNLVHRLTAEFLVSRFGPASEGLTRSATRAMPSPEALREFLLAEQELRAARYAAAVTGFQQAVAEDTTFALAYYRLAVAAMLNHSLRVTGVAIEHARTHAAQLGSRDHRLLDALALVHAGRADEAEAAYVAILESYPDDLEARVQLGGLLALYNPLRGRAAAEANAHLRRVSALDPAYVCPVCTMVNLALHEQDVRTADSIMTVRYGDSPLHAYYAGTAAARGDVERMEALLPQVNNPLFWQASWVAAFFDRYDLAERLLVEPRPLDGLSLQQQVIARLGIVDLHVARLEWRGAMEELARVEAIAPRRAMIRHAYLSLLPFLDPDTEELEAVRQRLADWQTDGDIPAAEAMALFDYLPLVRGFLLGLANSRLNEASAALAEAQRLDQPPVNASAPGLAHDLALTIRADVALGNEDYERALAHLDSIRARVPMEIVDAVAAGPGRSEIADVLTLDHARFLRIRTLLHMDRAGEAMRWIDNGFFRIGGNPLFGPELHLARAEALVAMGEADRARASYGRYLEITSHADPDLRSTPDNVRAILQNAEGHRN